MIPETFDETQRNLENSLKEQSKNLVNIETLITFSQHSWSSFNKERHGTAFTILAAFWNEIGGVQIMTLFFAYSPLTQVIRGERWET